MVLFIKSYNDPNIDLLCKMMINIEQNKTVYDIRGNENPPNIRNPFNYYTYQQVDYEMTVSMGTVLIYGNNTIQNIEGILVSKFNELNKNDTNTMVPAKCSTYNSTTYTLMNKKPGTDTTTSTSTYGTAYRKIITSQYDIKKCCESGSKFVWFIQQILQPHLMVTELCQRMPSKPYLMKSISTIICDCKDLFSVSNNLKQLDYPSLNQYTMFNDGQILDEPINISDTYGLDYEILKCYVPDLQQKFSIYGYKVDTVDYNEYKIRRLNPTKSWQQQLTEPFDYDQQELLEKDNEEIGKPPFRNDVCFITGMPLYENAYMLKIVFMRNAIEVDEKTVSYILVSPFFVHNILINKKRPCIEYYLKIHKIKVLEHFKTKFGRSESDAIRMIPDKLISPLKKDIMLAISINGAYKKNDTNLNNIVLYTADLEKNKIYLGIMNNIYDTNIAKYYNTNTILFQYTCS